MIGRILIYCHVSRPGQISGLNLPTHTTTISPSSLGLLSALIHPQHSYSSQQHYHTSVITFPHPTSRVRHPAWTSSPSLTVCWRHTSSVSSPPEEGGESGWLKQRWIKFKTIIKAFVAGSKALYGDVKKMRQIQSKHKGREMVLGQPPKDGKLEFPLTREELFFITKTKKDLWRMLPTVTLFWIPFLGYFVPLVAFMFPHIFLSPHFLTEEQRTELNASKHQKIIAKTKDFSAALKKREKSEQLSFLYKASDMFISGQVSDELILANSSGGNPALRNVNKENMSGLLGVWRIRSWIPFAASRQWRKLSDQMKYIYTSDWLMKQEGGVETLSSEALIEVCCERRLDVDLSSSEDMRKKLNVWMRISTSFEAECPEFVLAHLPAAQYLQDRTNK